MENLGRIVKGITLLAAVVTTLFSLAVLALGTPSEGTPIVLAVSAIIAIALLIEINTRRDA